MTTSGPGTPDVDALTRAIVDAWRAARTTTDIDAGRSVWPSYRHARIAAGVAVGWGEPRPAGITARLVWTGVHDGQERCGCYDGACRVVYVDPSTASTGDGRPDFETMYEQTRDDQCPGHDLGDHDTFWHNVYENCSDRTPEPTGDRDMPAGYWRTMYKAAYERADACAEAADAAIAQRDAARAELDQMRTRIEALCDKADRRPWNGTVPAFRVIYVNDLRAALSTSAGDPR